MWMTSSEAAARLRVKQSTVYAYVSRGLIRRTTHGRRTLLRRDDVEKLAARGRKAIKASGAPAKPKLLETSVSAIAGDRLSYRGRDAVALSRTWAFEQVAVWLWTGREPPPPSVSPWPAAPPSLSAQPADQLPLDRMITALCLAAPSTENGAPADVQSLGTSLITCLVASLGGSARPTIAGRLTENLLPGASPAATRLVEAAMILGSEHGLAAPTVNARTVASIRGDLRLGTVAGLCAMRGTQPGAAALHVESLLRGLHAMDDDGARETLRRLLHGTTPTVPGTGHPIYQTQDPRAVEMLSRLRQSELDPRRIAKICMFMHEAARAGRFVNFDFALGALSYATRMRRGSAEAVFGIARTAGWIAHMTEELTSENNFRLDGIYVGPEPSMSHL